MADLFIGLLMPDEWAALRNWLATIVGRVALLIAPNTSRCNVRIKREEKARPLYSRIDEGNLHEAGEDFHMGSAGSLHCVAISTTRTPGHGRWFALSPYIQVVGAIHNGSRELIGPVKAQIVNGSDNSIRDKYSIQLDAVEPESNKYFEFTWRNEFHPGASGLGTTGVSTMPAGSGSAGT
ncbi:hypothetical protein [Cryobacterium luteum]|uniref:Uncharacterized protein n=1 Tax=Cryobacterium luteum TaxID=1424661 RepID=A0A5F0D078_9MICO|nr:hypothetical protein [Cryobacterium luteum]TFB84653.1 hypothetical protein E3O10_16175 [Cryobacterium luteum]